MSTTLSPQTKVTLGAVGCATVALVTVAVWVGSILLSLRDQITELKSSNELSAQVAQTERAALWSAIGLLEEGQKDRWTAEMQEIHTYQCREAGTWVDPGPIIDRYSK